jgi:glycosyltransferase involved in cell wall biosynthesis
MHMRILHIGKFFYPYQGGIENFLRDLASATSDEGLAVSILVHQERPFEPTRTDLVHGLEVTRAFSLGQTLYTPLAPSFPYQLWRAVESFKPDLLHLHLPNPSAFWVLFLRPRRPFLIQWQADVVYSEGDRSLAFFYRFYRWFEKALLKRAGVIVASSREYFDESEPLQPFRARCRIVPLGLNPGRIYRPAVEEVTRFRNLFGGNPIVLSVGRFTHYKGFQILIEAACLVPQARFVMVGDGALREEMIRKVKSLGLAGRVFLVGHLSERELHTAMAACDVFCLPSVERSESFGLVLLEAMALSRPLITMRVKGSGVNWVNQHGRTGLVVEQADARHLAQAINALLGDAELCRAMGREGHERMYKLFHIRTVTKSILSLYSSLHAPPSVGM